jgi:uncharacterized protein (UPF0264 family)
MAVVPVLLVDAGLEPALLERALGCAGIAGLMVDTADKQGGSLLQRVPRATLAAFVAATRARGKLVSLAGSLGLDYAEALLALAPDFAGFRGAVARGGRAGPLDPRRVRSLRRRLAAHAHAALAAGG